MRSRLGILGSSLALAVMACGGGSGTVVTGGGSYPEGSSYPETEPGYAPSQGVVVGQAETIPSGTEIWVELAHPISLEHNRVGDRFQAQVSQELRSEYGQILIPLGARVEGTIVDLRPAYADQPAAIGLRIDALDMGGVRQPLTVSIIRTEVPGVQRVRGRDVLIGAAAGAILGGILKGGEGAIVGAALGAGGGALISLGRGAHATERLPSGTSIAVRLEQPVTSLAALRYHRGY